MAGRGFFIVLEGAADTGKSSSSRALIQRLDRMQVASIAVRELVGGPIATIARGYAQKGSHAHALACLACADRYRLLSDTIGPALAAGTTVVLERYVPSTLVYQGMQGLPRSFLLALNRYAPVPDFTVHLVAPAREIVARRGATLVRDAFQDDAKLGLELAGYRDVMRQLRSRGWTIVQFDSAKRTVDQIADAMAARIERLLAVRSKSDVAQ